MTPAQKKALEDYRRAVDAYGENGNTEYTSAGELTTEDLGPSAMGDVRTDPLYKQHELEALKQLEEQSREGLTARDRAALAGAERSANRANRGRIGAIQQEMAARGASGSGLDLVAQMQSSQDANELAAMKALETAGMAADRRSQATRDMGNYSSGLRNQDFNEQSAKARAADEVAQFNNRLRNGATQANWQNAQSVSNANTSGANSFQQNVLNANTGAAQVDYNAATEEENRRLLEAQRKAAAKAAKAHATGALIGTVVGGVGGAMVGGPMGASAGASMGSQLGGGIADASGPGPTGYAHGGRIPGHAEYPGDDPRNDTVLAKLSPGEEVESREMVAKDDAIGDLLMAVAKLHKTKSRK